VTPIGAAPPEMIRWVRRNPDNGDCGIVALQLACGLTYEAVLAAALKVAPKALEKGLSMTNLQRTAKALGFSGRWRRRYDIEADTGLLYVETKHLGHVVYLWAGRVIEPKEEAMWQRPADYLAFEKAKAGSLLVLDPQ
jgi:hypothetical protein